MPTRGHKRPRTRARAVRAATLDSDAAVARRVAVTSPACAECATARAHDGGRRSGYAAPHTPPGYAKGEWWCARSDMLWP
jgi:hypothetical protein